MSDYWKKKLDELNESNAKKSITPNNYWKKRQEEKQTTVVL